MDIRIFEQSVVVGEKSGVAVAEIDKVPLKPIVLHCKQAKCRLSAVFSGKTISLAKAVDQWTIVENAESPWKDL